MRGCIHWKRLAQEACEPAAMPRAMIRHWSPQLHDWWTEADAKEFQKCAVCIDDQ
jgi:hypothetical protein